MIRSTHNLDTRYANIYLVPSWHSRTLGLLCLLLGASVLLVDAYQSLINIPPFIGTLSWLIVLVGAVLCIREKHTLDLPNQKIMTTKRFFLLPVFKQTMDFDFSCVQAIHARDNEKFYLKHYHKNGYKSSDHYRTYQNVLTTVQFITKDKDELHLYTTIKHAETQAELMLLADIFDAELDYQPSEAETVKFNYTPIVSAFFLASSAISAYLYFTA